jgi:hypothetical protein
MTNWKNLEYKDRWLLVCGALQAAAAVGTFLAALVGLWSVAPIITYHIEQQEKSIQREKVSASEKLLAPKTPTAEPSAVAQRFVADVLAWWTPQVDSYQRILQLTGAPAKGQAKLGFKIVQSADVANIPGGTVDVLVVTATDAAGKTETVQVPVNAKAMPPSQYIQCKINQGAFASLDPQARLRVEQAIGRYLHAYMLPKATPAYVRPDMSVEQLRAAISYHQEQRHEASRHIRALAGIIDAALER